jgi:hypothetical protein
MDINFKMQRVMILILIEGWMIGWIDGGID